jgi:hypothetical protein
MQVFPDNIGTAFVSNSYFSTLISIWVVIYFSNLSFYVLLILREIVHWVKINMNNIIGSYLKVSSKVFMQKCSINE